MTPLLLPSRRVKSFPFEQSFRFTTWKDNGQGRFMSALSLIQGKRAEYKEVIGQTRLGE